MKNWKIATIFIALLLFLVACGNKEMDTEEKETDRTKQKVEEVTVTHEYGETKVKKTPENVVVFDFGVLDTLDELGIEVTGVPQANVPNYLEKYLSDDYTNVGSLKEPDFEAIHQLNPDVIFISTRQAELYDELAKIAPTVYVGIDYDDYIGSFKNNMNLIGEIFDKKEKMNGKLEEVDKAIEKVREKNKTNEEEQQALIVLANEGKVSAYGPASRYGLIHDLFGFAAADEKIEVSTHGQGISFEYILETNPDILFVIDRSAALDRSADPAKSYVENELVQKTNAYKDGKIVYLDAQYWYLSGGGLQSMKEMIANVESLLEQ